MHPHTFYSTLFESQKREEVFVIMSLSTEFEPRWRDVIKPCIEEDLGLKAVRVDYNVSGESVVHDILDGIAHAKLVLADITSSPMLDKKGLSRPQRNGNVMWELGIAHVLRVPDEVLVVRTDAEPSIFDLTQFRAFPYDAHDSIEARRIIAELIRDRLRSVDQSASDHVRRCASSLDFESWMLLTEAAKTGAFHPPVRNNMGQILGGLDRVRAIDRLLEMGALTTLFVEVTHETIAAMLDKPAEEAMRYCMTPFGEAVLRYCTKKMGITTHG